MSTIYIKCGGGGLPPQVVTDMNAVLNKKLETATTYPSNTWAGIIEDMTPLPEKTASGTIATFNDGADLVPLKSLTLTVTPSQSGTGDPSPTNPRPLNSFSSLKFEHTGKNLFDGSILEEETAWQYYDLYLPVGNYTMSTTKPDSNDNNLLLYFRVSNDSTLSSTTKVYDSHPVTRTITEGQHLQIAYRRSSGTDLFSNYTYMVEYGNTATAYEPYHTDPHTLDLGSTVYGLTGGVVSGEFEETHGFITFDGSENWQENTTGVYYIGVSGMNELSNCNIFGVIERGSSSGLSDLQCRLNSLRTNINFKNTSITSLADWKTFVENNNIQIAYELATPSELTTDPVEVESFKGVNNIWCDKDNSSVAVEYRADIELSLQ